MALGNTIPGFIKIYGKQPRHMRVLKNSIHLVGDIVCMKVATGLRAKMKKVPEKFAELIQIPVEEVYLHPCGTEAGLLNGEAVERVFTNVGDIFPDLVKKYKQIKQEREQALLQNIQLKDKMKELIEMIKKSQSENPILIAHAEGVSQMIG